MSVEQLASDTMELCLQNKIGFITAIGLFCILASLHLVADEASGDGEIGATTLTTTTSEYELKSPEDNSPSAGNPEAPFSYPTPTPLPPSTTTSSTTTTTTIVAACEYSYLDTIFDTSSQGGGNDFRAGDPQAPACVGNHLNEAYQECLAIYTAGQIAWVETDDCIAWKVFGASMVGSRYGVWSIYFGDYSSIYWNWNIAKYGLPRSWANYTRTLNPYSQRLFVKRNGDGSCSAISEGDLPNGTTACYAGTYHWSVSPISLLWDNSVDIDKEINIVKFKLNLQEEQEEWSVWKASTKAPLLVYDPEHTGKITSAAQLFGNWTFGGKTDAKMASNVVVGKPFFDVEPQFVSNTTPWSDGYEALSTLDADKDGKVSGPELSPLALWFDENSNAVAEAEEVKSLNEVQVVELYYKSNRTDEITKSIYADYGFKRIVHGQVIVGTSVDWRGDTAKNKAELINRHLAQAESCNRSANQKTEISKSLNLDALKLRALNSLTKGDKAVISNTTITATDKSNISGLWKWHSADIAGRPDGYLGFRDEGDGKILGHTYSTFGVSPSVKSFSHILSNVKFEGKKIKGQSNKFRISFNVAPDDTSIIESVAEYNSVTGVITGHSVAKISYGMKAIDLKYSWTATRVP